LGPPVQSRPAQKIPFTFVSCTGRTSDVEWAKEIEEKNMPGTRKWDRVQVGPGASGTGRKRDRA
jgi:hypothetical protein